MPLTAASDSDLGSVGGTGVHIVLDVVGIGCVGVSAAFGLWIAYQPTRADRRNPRFSRGDHPHFDETFAAAAVHFVDVLRFCQNVGRRRGLEPSS
jgi:hypothetical protein